MKQRNKKHTNDTSENTTKKNWRSGSESLISLLQERSTITPSEADKQVKGFFERFL